jgi:hypothetical protein
VQTALFLLATDLLRPGAPQALTMLILVLDPTEAWNVVKIASPSRDNMNVLRAKHRLGHLLRCLAIKLLLWSGAIAATFKGRWFMCSTSLGALAALLGYESVSRWLPRSPGAAERH